MTKKAPSRRLKRNEPKVIDPKIAEHRGRIVKTTGDGALVEFASAVDAVRCAMEIQRAMCERNAAIPEDRRIEFRIGINVGDIIVDKDDIYGDGMKYCCPNRGAGRAPVLICLSDNAYQQIKGKVSLDVSDMGEQQLKNIAQPVRAFSVRLEGMPVRSSPAFPDTPSIAVLPFTNMSGDPEQEYFADGITDDIITDLSKIAGLLVIARNSSFAYKGRSIDIRTIGRELGVRSVLEGSIRRAGNRVRITAQLINAANGVHLWAERYDRDLTDIFAVQDEVTRHIVNALKIKLTSDEAVRIACIPTNSSEAHDLFLRGREMLLA